MQWSEGDQARVHDGQYPAATHDDGVVYWRNAPPIRMAVPDAVDCPVPDG